MSTNCISSLFIVIPRWILEFKRLTFIVISSTKDATFAQKTTKIAVNDVIVEIYASPTLQLTITMKAKPRGSVAKYVDLIGKHR